MKVFIGGLILIGVIMSGCAEFGTNPSKEVKKTFHSSKQYNKEKNEFQNRRARIFEEMKKRGIGFSTIWNMISKQNERKPKEKMPEISPDLSKFMALSDELKIIWFGHSSFVLNIEGKVVLVDPVFSGTASPFSWIVKRFQKPVLSLKQLPKVDYIVISHDHYDHLDMKTVEFFKDKETKFFTPLGVGSHLEGWGIKKENIIEKDWWESEIVDGIEFVATPAQHFSGRNGINANETLWASWVIRSQNHNVYFSGDTGYDSHFKDIGEKYGPFDIAFLESGQYNEKWKEVHMLPEEAIMAFKDLKARKYFPVHWGMFILSLHHWSEPVEKLTKLSEKHDVDLVTPKLGQIVNLKSDTKFERWWEKVVDQSIGENSLQAQSHVSITKF